MERWREWCTRLDVCDRKLAKAITGQVKEKVPDTSFLTDRSSLPEPLRLNILLSTACMRKCVLLACHRPVGFSFLFIIIIIMLCKIFPVVASDQYAEKELSPNTLIIIIMYIYHALINALSAHMIHINLNMIFYTHVEHSPTK